MGEDAKNYQRLEDIAEETGQHIPILDRKPVLRPHIAWVWWAWIDMNRLRKFNEAGPQPITHEEIVSFASLHGLCQNEDIRDLRFFIPRLEERFIEISLDKMAKKREELRSRNSSKK